MCTRCKLDELHALLSVAVKNFECACRPDHKDKKGALVSSYHIQEISNHFDRIKYHVDQMMVAQDMMRNNNNLPAEKIRHEIKLAEQKVLKLRDKKMSRSSSLKYITKWEEILEKHWAQQNRKEYDYEGVNIVDFKSLVVKPKLYKSSDCILESEKEDESVSPPLAKSNSAGNLLETIGGGRSDNDGNMQSEFLLSLKDLENLGDGYKREKKNLEFTKSCGALNDRKVLQRKKSADDVPRIVGVVYKMRL